MTMTWCVVTNKSTVTKSIMTGGRTFIFFPGLNKPMLLSQGALIFAGRHPDLVVQQTGAEVYDENGRKVKSESKKCQITPKDVKKSAEELAKIAAKEEARRLADGVDGKVATMSEPGEVPDDVPYLDERG